MKRRLWISLAVTLVAIAVVVALALANVPPRLEWRFLRGQAPHRVSIQEFGWSAEGDVADYEIDGHSNRDGPATLRRLETFTFRADYEEVLRAARKEVEAAGWREDKWFADLAEKARKDLLAKGQEPRHMDFVMFGNGSDWMLSIRRTIHGPNGEEDPTLPFVSVTISTTRTENFVGIARRWLRGIVH